jgi:branched-chain amino acid transport system permease protein
MFHQLFSGDFPRSRTLAVVLIAIFIGLALAPFLSASTKSLNVAANICIFIVLVASFDLLIGYTGIVSFAQTIFFGVGAYGVAIALIHLGSNWSAVFVGVVAALGVSLALGLIIGVVSMRVPIITLAIAIAFETLATQFSEISGGTDGLTVKVPVALTPAFSLREGPFLGAELNGKFVAYYLVFTIAVVMFLLLLRIVNSPFGRVLQAIRENEFRAEALGYRVVLYRCLSFVISAGFATIAGVLLMLWVRYISPGTSLSLDIMLYILLMVVIGGMGTLYGAVIGATLIVAAQFYLQDLIGVANKPVAALPIIGRLLSPLFSSNRWLLWLGILFVSAVCFFPAGVVGEVRKWTAKSRAGSN